MSKELDRLVAKLATAIKAEEAAAERYARSNMNARLFEAWEKRKATREEAERQLAGPQQDELEAQLRSNGEDEMRRRWREAEAQGLLSGSRRIHFITSVEKMAADDRPERQRFLRENMGEREAQFRQGIAQEARRLLRNLQPDIRPPTERELQEGRESAAAWVRGLKR